MLNSETKTEIPPFCFFLLAICSEGIPVGGVGTFSRAFPDLFPQHLTSVAVMTRYRSIFTRFFMSIHIFQWEDFFGLYENLWNWKQQLPACFLTWTTLVTIQSFASSSLQKWFLQCTRSCRIWRSTNKLLRQIANCIKWLPCKIQLPWECTYTVGSVDFFGYVVKYKNCKIDDHSCTVLAWSEFEDKCRKAILCKLLGPQSDVLMEWVEFLCSLQLEHSFQFLHVEFGHQYSFKNSSSRTTMKWYVRVKVIRKVEPWRTQSQN